MFAKRVTKNIITTKWRQEVEKGKTKTLLRRTEEMQKKVLWNDLEAKCFRLEEEAKLTSTFGCTRAFYLESKKNSPFMCFRVQTFVPFLKQRCEKKQKVNQPKTCAVGTHRHCAYHRKREQDRITHWEKAFFSSFYFRHFPPIDQKLFGKKQQSRIWAAFLVPPFVKWIISNDEQQCVAMFEQGGNCNDFVVQLAAKRFWSTKWRIKDPKEVLICSFALCICCRQLRRTLRCTRSLRVVISFFNEQKTESQQHWTSKTEIKANK